MPNVDPAAVQGLAAQMAIAAIVAGVLFAFSRAYPRHFLRYWLWSWLAFLVANAAAAFSLFGRSLVATGGLGRPLLNVLAGSAGYLQLLWILFGSYEMATRRRLPKRLAWWAPVAFVVLTAAAVAVTGSPQGLRTRLTLRASVHTLGYLAGAWAVARLASSAHGGLGKRLMATALMGSGLQNLYYLFGTGLLSGGPVFHFAHSGVLGLTLQTILSLAMVVWQLEGEREHAIVLAAERERAERQRADASQFTAEIVASAAQAIVAMDRRLRIEVWNPFAETLFALPAAEVVGKSAGDVFPPPNDAMASLVGRALRGETVFVTDVPSGLGNRPWCAVTFCPRRDAAGEITGVIALISDITESKRAQEARERLESALRAAASDWKSTFDAVDVLVVVLDSEGRVTRLNRAALDLAGGSYTGSLGRRLVEMGQGEPWTTGAALAGRLSQTGSRVAEVARDSATGRVWGLSLTRFSNPEGGEVRTVLVARDITPVVRLEESLRRKEHMSVMGLLVAGVAHEVRNPLFGISSTIDAFEARFGDAEKHQRYLSTLRTQVDRLRQLMSDLLEYGKPPASEPRLENLADVVGEAVRSCDLQARRSQVSVEDDTPADLPRVSVDRPRMVQVFQNVLQNAIEHAGRGGRVVVDARAVVDRGEERVHASVRDTGPGFQEVDIPRLFEPFFTRRRGGTGLGLSIVQRIVEEAGGRVSARNHPEGGALVTIDLSVGQAVEAEVGLVRAALP